MKELIRQIFLVSLASVPAIALSASEGLNDVDARYRLVESRGKSMMAAVTDAWIKGKIESALVLNEYLNISAIDVDVHDNRVLLTGAVPSDIDADLARQIAQSVDGVETVIDRLTVDATVRVTRNSDGSAHGSLFQANVKNATLAARIKSELRNTLTTRANDIDVESHEGRMILTGFVESEQTKKRAGDIAHRLNDAGSVVNRIQIR